MPTPFTPYQKRLFVFLSVATFLKANDFLALAQILPNLRADFGIDEFQAGLLFAFVNFGTIVAWLLIRRADQWGRRNVMMITIVGYTVFTFLSGLAWDVWSFALFQFIARVFLIGEWATSMVYASEEYPNDRRGTVIGVLQAFSSLGAVFCAGITPFLLTSAYGWRTVYLVGVFPLIILAFARRNLKETRRFEKLKADGKLTTGDFFAIMRGPHRRRVLQLASIWIITYACSHTAISFWKDFALNERSFSDGDVGFSLTVASIASMPMVFLSGKLLDSIGRKWGSTVIFILTSLGVFSAYYFEGQTALTLALVFAIFGVSAVLPALNTFTTELFPTEVRSDAFGWANNLLGRLGYVISPIFIGWAAERWSWGAAIRPTAVFPLLALVLIWWLLPETNGKDIDEANRAAGA